MSDNPFKRKVKTLMGYAGVSMNRLAQTVGLPRQSLVNRLNLEMKEEMQRKVMSALYFAAGPALAEDLKELETTIDYLDDNHREEQHG